MNVSRSAKTWIYAGLLIVFGASQSACVLLKPFGFFKDKPQQESRAMASFRYDIPRPFFEVAASAKPKKEIVAKKSVSEERVLTKFKIKSFIEKILPQASRSPKKKDTPVATVASVKPSKPTPSETQRSRTQTEFCEQINRRLSSIDQQHCMAAKLSETWHVSVNRTPILRAKFSRINGVTPTGRILLLGGVHGDELSSVSIVFEWLKFLRVHHDGEFVWNVIPVVNPDGLFRAKPSRTNANGVDLNRNMPTRDWQGSALSYWRNRAKRSPRKFPGFSPASEPETRWLVEEIDRFKPDMIVSVHAPHNLIDYDAPSRKNAPRQFGKLKGGLLGTFPGSLGNYAGVKRGIPVVTIELPSASQAISIKQAHQMWADMLAWLEKTIPLENKRFMENRRFASLDMKPQ